MFSSPLVDLSRTWKGSLVQLYMNQAWFHMTVQNSYFGAVTSPKGHLQLCPQDTVRLILRYSCLEIGKFICVYCSDSLDRLMSMPRASVLL